MRPFHTLDYRANLLTSVLFTVLDSLVGFISNYKELELFHMFCTVNGAYNITVSDDSSISCKRVVI